MWQVAWSHPKFGIVLASCSFDGSVLIHRESRPREWTLIHNARTLHESSVNSVAFAAHEFGLIVAAASSDGRISILTHGSSGDNNDDSWNVDYIADNSLGVNSVSFAPYTAYNISNNNNSQEQPAATATAMHIVSGGCDNRIRFWNKSNTTHKWEMDLSPIADTDTIAHSDWVRDVAWAPSVLPNTNIVASCSEDRTVIIWTQKGGVGNTWKPTLLNTFEEPVWRVSWSVTGSILAVSSGDNSVSLWKQTLDGEWTQVSSVEETK